MTRAQEHSGFLDLLAGPLTALWMAGGAARVQAYQMGWLHRKRLRAKVISVGNISFGGTGKTPFTIWLAERLLARGYRVSILTRGYKRTSQGIQIIPPINEVGTSGDGAVQDGDEVQLFRRHLPQIPIGIADRRFEAGCALELRYPIDVHLLDDGFQHLPLERDLDIVLIDSSNPWGNRGNVPQALRRSPRVLRESPSALRRAHMIVLTRTELGETDNASRATSPAAGETLPVKQLAQQLREIHPTAPIHAARTRLLHFVNSSDGSTVAIEAMRERRVAAFCGLGHPHNFFTMLEHAGIQPLIRRVFPDHTLYSESMLRELFAVVEKSQANCLLCSEKDIVNLPPRRNFALPLFWAAIQFEVPEEEALLEQVIRAIGPPASSSLHEVGAAKGAK